MYTLVVLSLATTCGGSSRAGPASRRSGRSGGASRTGRTRSSDCARSCRELAGSCPPRSAAHNSRTTMTTMPVPMAPRAPAIVPRSTHRTWGAHRRKTFGRRAPRRRSAGIQTRGPSHCRRPDHASGGAPPRRRRCWSWWSCKWGRLRCLRREASCRWVAGCPRTRYSGAGPRGRGRSTRARVAWRIRRTESAVGGRAALATPPEWPAPQSPAGTRSTCGVPAIHTTHTHTHTHTVIFISSCSV
jgi:hypothetical protein